jgi:rhodanese-related sulfurtransferase
MNRIDLDRVVELQNQGAQLVEVLSRKQFAEQHLPGAISLPLSKFRPSELAKLDKDRPVIVYCWDYQWDLSPRAAARLQAAGFREVYDYTAGKADWLAMGMPSAGSLSESTVQKAVRAVPVCKLREDISDIRARISGEWNIAAAIDESRIVLGLLDFGTIEDAHGVAEDRMKPAPLTLRPSVLITEAAGYLEESDLTFALVTKSTGELLGGIRKNDLVGWYVYPFCTSAVDPV